MGIVNKELIEKGLALETARRNGPKNEKGLPSGFEVANKEYQEFLYRHGFLLLDELRKRIQ